MFRIQMLPARQGDAILIEYGPDDAPRRIVVDGGTPGAKNDFRSTLVELGPPPVPLELLVVTHVDGDHIGGVLETLEDDPGLATFGDVWFNAWRHLQGNSASPLGPVQGERLTMWLDTHAVPWNAAFDTGPVVVTDQGNLPVVELSDGLLVTVLSPGPGELAKLRPVWEAEVRKAGLEPGNPYTEEVTGPSAAAALGPPPTHTDVELWARTEFEPDRSEANGASISLLLEYEGRSVLLTGDAHSESLVQGVTTLLEERETDRLEVDVFKLPHHGSRRNVSEDLLEVVQARAYLFSTNGAVYGHPDLEAVARVALVARGASLCFNYPDRVGIWSEPTLVGELGYRVETQVEGQLTVEL